jgi:hypothetical protein
VMAIRRRHHGSRMTNRRVSTHVVVVGICSEKSCQYIEKNKKVLTKARDGADLMQDDYYILNMK